MDARAKAMGAAGPADASRKEGELSQALGRLLAVAENYPQLKSNENVKMLQEELSATENKIGFARQFYNDIATKFNISRETFPTNLFANMFGFSAAELFQIHAICLWCTGVHILTFLLFVTLLFGLVLSEPES